MPRRTHPRPRPKHSRAHVSHQRDRYIARRWRLAEDLYNDDFWLAEKIHEPGPVGSDKRRLLHLFRQVGPVLFMHPEVIRRLPRRLRERSPWPFSLPRGDYARNPFTRCSCLDCTNWKRLDPSRAREKRQWRRVEQTVARMGDLNRSLHHP